MKCMIRYAVFLALITLAPNRSSAQASDIIGGIAGALLNAAVNAVDPARLAGLTEALQRALSISNRRSVFAIHRSSSL